MIASENDRALGGYMLFANNVDAAEERVRNDTNQRENQALHHFDIFRA